MSRAIEFGSLLGAQISALVEAEVRGAERTSEFIEATGFERDADGRLVLQTVSFEMQRRDADGVVRPHVVRVPTLTLVPLPLLTIESAQLDFALQVEQVAPTNDPPGGSPIAASLGLAIGKRHTLIARHARAQASDQTVRSDLRVSVKLTQSALPLGIERLLGAADLSVEDETDA